MMIITAIIASSIAAIADYSVTSEGVP